MKSRRLVVGTAACLLVMASVGEAKTTKTVRVDCTKGDSINAALQDKAEELIVEIKGMCHEDVRIGRSFVTLRGTDLGTDGIVGSSPAEPDPPGLRLAVVQITRADSVRLENLLITGGRHGIFASHGETTQIVNCRVADFDRTGIISWIGSHVFCTGCTVEGDGWAVLSADGDIHFDASTLRGERGATNWRGYLELNDTSVEAVRWGLVVGSFGEIIQSGGTLQGSIYAERKSIIRLEEVSQTASPFANFIVEDSTLQARGSTLIGTTFLYDFSNGSIWDESTLGDLVCETGADLSCDGTETKASSSCGLCP